MSETMGANLSPLNPEHDARLLSEAGFRDVAMLYTAFTCRGWQGYA
jgi:tRNA (cmo5U34)-methyltransferase